MQSNAKFSIVFLSVLTLVGCAARALEDPERKPATRSSSAGTGPYDYTENPYSGWGAQPAKEAGSTASGGSGGRMDAGGGTTAGGSGAGGTATSPGVAGTCPSLTLARASNGDCVPRVTEFEVALKPTSIVRGSDGRIWVDDDRGDELLQLDDFGQVIGRVPCEEGSSPRALAGGAGDADDAIVWYTSAGAKELVKIDRRGARVTTPLGFQASALAVAPSGDVFLSEFGKAVYRLPADGSAPTRWPASPTDVMVVSGDTVWLSEGASLGRLRLDRGLEHFSLGDAAYASGLCLASDSGLWFSDGFAHQLVGVNAEGTPFPALNLPTGTAPGAIIVGPDGALWFTETGTSRLGSATRKGVITHYPLPTPDGLPRALVVGSDGNIWFTAPWSRKVGRLIPDAAP